MYDTNELANMLDEEIQETGKDWWSAKDIYEFFLSQGIKLSLEDVISVWNACPNPVCACELLGCDEAIMASDVIDNNEVVIQFGDGNGAASRGMECDNDCEIYGSASSAQLALAAGYFVDYLDDNFTDDDILNCIEDYGESVDYDWERALSSRDIGGGAPLVYRILFNGKEIYYDEYLEEEVKSCGYDDYDDDDITYSVDSSAVFTSNGQEVDISYVAENVKDYITNYLPKFIANDNLAGSTGASIRNYCSYNNITNALYMKYGIGQKHRSSTYPISQDGMEAILQYFGVTNTFELPDVFGL